MLTSSQYSKIVMRYKSKIHVLFFMCIIIFVIQLTELKEFLLLLLFFITRKFCAKVRQRNNINLKENKSYFII